MRLLCLIFLLFASPLAADTAAADAEPLDELALHHSMYVHINLGAQRFPDASWRPGSNYVDNNSYNGGSNGSDTGLLAELGLGYQSPEGEGIEVGFGLSPLYTIYAMPVFRLATGGLGSRPALHTFGGRVGWSVLNYSSGYYSSYDGLSINNDPGFPSYALTYRVEQMVGSRFSLGLDFSWHFARTVIGTTTSTYNYVTYTYDTTHQDTAFDYSGPSLALTLGLWPGRPFYGEADRQAKAEAEQRRLERAEARAERYRRRYGAPEPAPERSYASVNEAVAVGQAALDIDQPERARQAFQEAVLLDPQSAKAWRGLADAEYALKLRRKALAHYEKALVLGGPDPALQGFVVRLRSMLKAAPDAD